jgi:hypothetical protein
VSTAEVWPFQNGNLAPHLRNVRLTKTFEETSPQRRIALNETFIRSQHLACQVSQPHTHRSASNPAGYQNRNGQKDTRIVAGRIYAGSISSVDPWLSKVSHVRLPGAALPGGNSQFRTIFARSASLLLSVYLGACALGACAGSRGTANIGFCRESSYVNAG